PLPGELSGPLPGELSGPLPGELSGPLPGELPGDDSWTGFAAAGNSGPGETSDADDPGELGLLPRRVRQASLAPQLRTAAPPSPAVDEPDSDCRSPEQTRSLVSSMQRGWERGRSEPENDQPASDGENGSR